MHRRGLLRRAMRASISIPGVMPPVVIDGQVLVDGAVIKNFPTDVMRQLNAGPIVGVDMSQMRGVDPAALANPPSWWRWIVSGAWKKGPPIVSVLMRVGDHHHGRRHGASRAEADLLILPEPEGSDIRDWKIYEPVVAAGHAAAVEVLSKLERARSRPCASAPTPRPRRSTRTSRNHADRLRRHADDVGGNGTASQA